MKLTCVDRTDRCGFGNILVLLLILLTTPLINFDSHYKIYILEHALTTTVLDVCLRKHYQFFFGSKWQMIVMTQHLKILQHTSGCNHQDFNVVGDISRLWPTHYNI